MNAKSSKKRRLESSFETIDDGSSPSGTSTRRVSRLSASERISDAELHSSDDPRRTKYRRLPSRTLPPVGSAAAEEVLSGQGGLKQEAAVMAQLRGSTIAPATANLQDNLGNQNNGFLVTDAAVHGGSSLARTTYAAAIGPPAVHPLLLVQQPLPTTAELLLPSLSTQLLTGALQLRLSNVIDPLRSLATRGTILQSYGQMPFLELGQFPHAVAYGIGGQSPLLAAPGGISSMVSQRQHQYQYQGLLNAPLSQSQHYHRAVSEQEPQSHTICPSSDVVQATTGSTSQSAGFTNFDQSQDDVPSTGHLLMNHPHPRVQLDRVETEGRAPMVRSLFVRSDEVVLTEVQILLRKQLEF